MKRILHASALLVLAAGLAAGEWRAARCPGSTGSPELRAAAEQPRGIERSQPSLPVLFLLGRTAESNGAGKAPVVSAAEVLPRFFRSAARFESAPVAQPASRPGTLRAGRAPPARS